MKGRANKEVVLGERAMDVAVENDKRRLHSQLMKGYPKSWGRLGQPYETGMNDEGGLWMRLRVIEMKKWVEWMKNIGSCEKGRGKANKIDE